MYCINITIKSKGFDIKRKNAASAKRRALNVSYRAAQQLHLATTPMSRLLRANDQIQVARKKNADSARQERSPDLGSQKIRLISRDEEREQTMPCIDQYETVTKTKHPLQWYLSCPIVERGSKTQMSSLKRFSNVARGRFLYTGRDLQILARRKSD